MAGEFDPPEGRADDDPVRARARRNMYTAGATAVGLGLLQFCCNPFFLVSFACAGASLNAIRVPRWMKISLDEDYPPEAGTFSTVAGYVGLALFGLRLVVLVLAWSVIAIEMGSGL